MKQYAGGWQRDAVLECHGGKTTDHFIKVVSGVKLPDTQNATVDIDVAMLEECEARWYGNCSCLAYVAADIRGGDNQSGYVMWTDAIVDLRLIDSKQDLYLRLSKLEFDWLQSIKGDNTIRYLNGTLQLYMIRLKRARLTDKGRGEFLREVEVMSTLRHINLAELLYYCQDQEEDEWILVYEWMEKKSSNRYIFGEQNMPRSSPNWVQRLEIVRGVAVGVEFLHSKQVIHRDLKPGNILLDDSWNPKIADFATAKLFIADQTDPTVVLTPGYVAPEYAGAEPTLTYKCDVYSFGVVLTYKCDAWELWNRHDIEELLDQEVGEPGELLSALARCIQIGLLCVQQSPEEGRPAMSEVVGMLAGTDSHSQLRMPSRPTANSGAGPSVRLTPGPSWAL
ncbi:G-type lectin S-receptor-like serine/threonine-protein kinase At1g11410 [Triticum aestivum]|uniref:G-type lectin S-receptor-like serine/threonine-protein kinase At1g11410 n=1 Tax=Triticum aestivum TaxID=4565 RepID=UPI001D0198CC|nr:G-type lectin S-receptor-like serine/threonine-protein kinase At1g11410 [Triticum aestivum]